MHPRLADAKPVEPVGFDLIEWRREQAEHNIAKFVPSRFADAEPDMPEVCAWVDQFLADPKTCPTLLLLGPTGTGKTHQMFGALKAILRGLADQGRGLDFRVTSHPDLNDALRPKPDGSNAYALEPYLRAELVLLDDLGTGKQTEWTGDSLYRLVDHRWKTIGLPSMYTTNLLPKELKDVLGERVASRLADSTHVSVLGQDRRRTK